MIVLNDVRTVKCPKNGSLCNISFFLKGQFEFGSPESFSLSPPPRPPLTQT